MNVLFISSLQVYCSVEKPLYNQNALSLGVSYISSYLKRAGHETRMFVMTRDTPRRDLDRAIDEFKPGLIGFTAIFSEFAFIREVGMYVKERHPEIYLMAGGPHVSLNPEIAIQDAFDAICIGEGEAASLELVNQLQQGRSPSGIQNLWIRQNGKIEKNQTRPFEQDLDALPFPDRDMWQEWIDDPVTVPCILLGRGCPYTCTYCCNHALRALAPGNYVRFRSPENVLEEVKEFSARNPAVSHIYFEVETIGAKPHYAEALCSCLNAYNQERKAPLTFSVNLRIHPKKDFGPFFATLKTAHFTSVNIGLESGSPRVRKEVLRRTYSNDDVRSAVRAAKENGLKVHLYVLIGLPGETLEEFRETIELTRECEPDFYYLSIFTPYPGTVLCDKCKEMDLLENELDMTLERRRAVLDLPGFSRRQIQREYLLFAYRVYKGKWPINAIFRKVVGTWLRTSAVLYRCYRILMRRPRVRDFMRSVGWQWG
ncbi:MAG: B12-binding domain-containing radical SAM protein [Candidatus Hydrogenedentes bacterium]|nr:B12-binding domain-containing radical SAM protein [Candidatus Hydrogenedentota bacterium]